MSADEATGAVGVRKLVVYERSMQLAESVYRLTGGLPPTEQFGLASQLRRAATSVALNISEGYGRQHRRDYVRFLAIARGSANEVDTALELVERLHLLPGSDATETHRLCEEVIRMLTTMMKRLAE